MKIAIDVSSVVYGTGVSVYAHELINALANLKSNHEFILFAGTWRQKNWYRNWFNGMNLPRNFKLKIIPLPPRLQLLLWNDWKLTKLEWFIGEFDIYHSLDWSLAQTNKPTLITVHDLFFVKEKQIQQHPFAISLEKRLLTAKEKKLNVIAVSQTTKNDLVDVYNYDESLIKVIYEACPQNWKKITDIEKIKQVRNKWSIPENYFLAVSTQEPRKNLHKLVKSYNEINAVSPLVLVGRNGWGENLNINKNIICTGYIPTTDLMTLWSGSQGFIYPSLYEGFGLPILQSFVSQVPVLTSNNSSMKEIADKAAILIDPNSLDSIKKGLLELVHLDTVKRKYLIAKGLERVKQFNWEDTAQETMELYLRLA